MTIHTQTSVISLIPSQVRTYVMALNCPNCNLQLTAPPIYLCHSGHSICAQCTDDQCKICNKKVSKKRRNTALEQILIQTQSQNQLHCPFKGCKYVLVNTADLERHQTECRFRQFECEARKFAKVPCDWHGTFFELEQHFSVFHEYETLEFKDELLMPISFKRNSFQVYIVSFFHGSNYFWYKHCVDVSKEKIYWVFQFVGTSKDAHKFFYEFEISNGVRKLKMTEICENDTMDAMELFEQERCVVLPFRMAKNFLDEDKQLNINYRLMNMRKNT